MSDPAIHVMPFFEGRLPRTDLLNARMSFAAWISLSGLSDTRFFAVRADDFNLEASIFDGAIVLARNGYTVTLPLAPSGEPDIENRVQLKSPCHIVFTIGPTQLAVYVNGCPCAVETPPTVAPNSLLQWARRQAILPTNEYSSDRVFCDCVLNGLAGLEDKISATAMQAAFWDFAYDGKKIVSRRPKRETQVHPTVHGLLHDLALAKNITIHPEAASGSGRLDFLLTGVVRGGNTAKACVEFKHAHSDGLVHGLTTQLPDYMRTHGTDHGFYCVPWFKGDHFKQPKLDLGECRGSLIETKAKAGLDNINLILIDVSGGTPPSKTTAS